MVELLLRIKLHLRACFATLKRNGYRNLRNSCDPIFQGRGINKGLQPQGRASCSSRFSI